MRSRLNCFRMIGSRPSAGSSRITSSGRWASASTSPSRTFWPFDRCLIRVRSGSSKSRRYLQRQVVVPRRIERRDEPHDLLDAHPAVHRLVFGQVADAAAQLERLALRVESQHADRAVVALQQAEQHADGRRLAGRVAAEKRERLAALDLQRHAAQHLASSETTCRRPAVRSPVRSWLSAPHWRRQAGVASTPSAASAKKFVQLVGRKPSPTACRAICRSSSTSRARCAGQLALRRSAGDKRPLPVPHLEQPLAAQPLVHAQHRVLIDGQLPGQLAHRRQPLAGLQRRRRAERGDLLGNLPRDRHGRAFFDPQKHRENQLKTRK